jgi:hypothetical protein
MAVAGVEPMSSNLMAFWRGLTQPLGAFSDCKDSAASLETYYFVFNIGFTREM